jgi:hypothetical protein
MYMNNKYPWGPRHSQELPWTCEALNSAVSKNEIGVN